MQLDNRKPTLHRIRQGLNLDARLKESTRRYALSSAVLIGWLSLGVSLSAAHAPSAPAEPSGPLPPQATLHFKATAPFDPVRGIPDLSARVPHGPLLSSRSAAAAVFVVQYEGPATFGRQSELETLGWKVLDYVPENALLVRAGAGVPVGRVRSLRGVRSVFELTPAFKIAPELIALPDAATSPALPEPSSWIEASLFTGGSPDDLVAGVRAALPEVTVAWTKKTDPARVRFVAPAKSVKPLVGALASHRDVAFVSLALPPQLANDNSVWIAQSYDRVNGPGEALATDPKPYRNSATLWDHGLLGEGQVVGITDNDMRLTMGQFADPMSDILIQEVSPPDPLFLDHSQRKILAFNTYGVITLPHQCTLHGTHASGSILGDCSKNLATTSDPGHDTGDGMAPLAKLVFENGTPGLPAPLTDQLEQQYAAGARVSSYSWGMFGSTIDEAVWRRPDLTVFAAAGNHGYHSDPTSPSTIPSSVESWNKNAVVVGASENYDGTIGLDPENMAALSGEGPTPDGRIKPDVVITGIGVRSASPEPITYTDPNDPHCNPEDPNYCSARSGGGCFALDTSDICGTRLLSGTSMATPTAAGLAALVREYFVEGFYPLGTPNPYMIRVPSAALVKAVMINGSRNMTGHNRVFGGVDFGLLADAPSFKQGWGRLALDDALYFADDKRRLWLQDVANSQGLFTGDSMRYTVQVTSDDTENPLKVTLVWTDPPASSLAGPQLRNDLDLVITGADGKIYRGNQWIDDPSLQGDKRSAPNASGRDAVNNVEAVHITKPEAGLYNVEVRGTNVPGYPPDGIYKQGFALVFTAAASVIDGHTCTLAQPPQNLQASTLRWDDVLLTWQPVLGAVGYTVRRNTTGCATAPSLVVDVPAGTTSYHDHATQSGTTYSYTVRAVMSADGCQTADSDCRSATTLPAPQITSITPGYGVNSNPTPVTIVGAGFVATPQVYLGTASQPDKYPLSSINFISATEIRATVPVRLQTGAYTLKVVNPDTALATLANAFTIAPPLQQTTAFSADFGNAADLSGSLSAVNLETMALIETRNLGPNSSSADVAIRKDGSLGLLSIWGGSLRAFLPSTRTIFKTITGFPKPSGVVIHPSGNPAYVLSGGNPSTLRRIDLTTFAVTGTRTLGVGQSNSPVDDLEISADGSRIYATNCEDDTVSIVQTSDLTELGRVSVGDFPLRLTLSTDGTRLYVSNYTSETVTVVDTVSRTVLRTIDVSDHLPTMPTHPHALALSSNNTILHLANHGCCSGVTNRANVNLATDLVQPKITTAQHQWERLAFRQSQGKLYGLAIGLPSSFIRLNKDTLSIEATTTVGNLSHGMDIADPPALTVTALSTYHSCDFGGTTVTLTGSGFQGEVRDDAGNVVQQPTRVLFGGTEATSVTFTSSTSMTAVTPPHASSNAAVPVKVLNPNGRSAVLGGFYYDLCEE